MKAAWPSAWTTSPYAIPATVAAARMPPKSSFSRVDESSRSCAPTSAGNGTASIAAAGAMDPLDRWTIVSFAPPGVGGGVGVAGLVVGRACEVGGGVGVQRSQERWDGASSRGKVRACAPSASPSHLPWL